MSGCSGQTNNIERDDYPYALKDVRDWDFGSIFDNTNVTVQAGNESEDESQREDRDMSDQSGLSSKNIKYINSDDGSQIGTKSSKQGSMSKSSSNKAVGTRMMSSGYSKCLQDALWNASIIKVGKMPILSANKAAGVISTDWFMDSNDKNHKYKMTISIQNDQIAKCNWNANSKPKVIKKAVEKYVHVSIFKLERRNGAWIAIQANPKAAIKAQNIISDSAVGACIK